MTNLTDGERLVALETKMDTVIETLKGLSEKIDNSLPTYATKEELERLKRRNSWTVFVTGSLSALFGSILTFLVMYFVTTVGQ